MIGFETAMTDAEFRDLQTLIRQEAGIHLEPAKRTLLIGRLTRRMRKLGLSSFSDYYDRVCSGDGDEKQQMIDAICTNETHFFRDMRQFEFLRSVALPSLEKRTDSIRIWSAGCSTGEEPYSIAMTVLDTLGWPPRRRVDIVGTDLSSKALNAASHGIWPIKKGDDIPPHLLKAFLLRGVGERDGMIAAGPEIRSLIRFSRFNLIRDPRGSQTYDVIFCRNVLIYFDPPTRRRVIERLFEALAPGGYLFLGHAESLIGPAFAARSVGPTVYSQSKDAT